MTMDNKTLGALKGSIKKWQDIVDGIGVDKSASNCPLCLLFIDDDCNGCPVMRRTGATYCEETPYYDARLTIGYAQLVKTDVQRAAAQAELDFLKSLLPKENSNDGTTGTTS